MKNKDTAKILVVDDQIHALQGVVRIMKGAGYEVLEASNGEDCLKLAAEHKPDLILLDVVLPDIDGREVCKHIKSDPKTADIYVVLLSSIHIESDSQADGLEQGADGYIARPIPNRELLARVRAILRLKHAESRLRESEEKFRLIFEKSPVGIVNFDKNGVVTDCNQVFLEILETSREQVIGFNMLTSLRNEEVIKALKSALSGQVGQFEGEYTSVTGGQHAWAKLVYAPISNTEGLVTGGVGIFEDISERKRMEENILASEQRLKTITNSFFDAIILLDDKGEISFWNPASEQIFGYNSAEVIGKNLHELLAPPEYHTAYRSAFKDFAVSGRGNALGRTTELVARRKNGEEFPIALSLSSFQTNGRWHAAGIVRDVTERTRAEEALRQSEEKFAKVFHYGPALITLSNIDDGTYVEVNDKFCEVSGFSRAESVGKTSVELGWILPEDRRRLIEELQAHGSVRGMNIKLLTKNKTEIHCVYNGELIQTQNRQMLLSIAHDITELKRSEQEQLKLQSKLLQAQKLESLGVMAGGIAHDFNNQLAIVLGNLELALSDQTLDPKARQKIENATIAANRSAELSRQMLIYSGSALYLPKDLDLNELLNRNAGLLKSYVSKHITLNLENYSKIPPIKGDADQIQRLVMNIMTNASEAIGDQNGYVRLRTGAMDCDEAYLSLSRLDEKPRPGRFVFLEITDTGCGMDAETLHKLFDPFFTTKFWGRGLGMAEVMGITKGHRGALIVNSEVGKGTTIRVLFPVLQTVQASSALIMNEVENNALATDTVNRRKTILIVEDEPLVRDLVFRRLELLGYDSIIAGDGEEGVRLFRDRSSEIDLVMLDFKMPRMSGVEAFGELIRIKPEVKVILSSGYTEDVVIERFPGPRPAGILHKPYKIEDLKAELERLLGVDG